MIILIFWGDLWFRMSNPLRDHQRVRDFPYDLQEGLCSGMWGHLSSMAFMLQNTIVIGCCRLLTISAKSCTDNSWESDDVLRYGIQGLSNLHLFSIVIIGNRNYFLSGIVVAKIVLPRRRNSLYLIRVIEGHFAKITKTIIKESFCIFLWQLMFIWYLWSLFTFISVPCLDINLQFSDQILPNFIFSQI